MKKLVHVTLLVTVVFMSITAQAKHKKVLNPSDYPIKFHVLDSTIFPGTGDCVMTLKANGITYSVGVGGVRCWVWNTGTDVYGAVSTDGKEIVLLDTDKDGSLVERSYYVNMQMR